jgi:hypothetical protein
MNQDEEEDEEEDEVEDEDEDEDKDEDKDEDDSLLTFYEPLRMITKLILAEFTVFKKVVTDGRTD